MNNTTTSSPFHEPPLTPSRTRDRRDRHLIKLSLAHVRTWRRTPQNSHVRTSPNLLKMSEPTSPSTSNQTPSRALVLENSGEPVPSHSERSCSLRSRSPSILSSDHHESAGFVLCNVHNSLEATRNLFNEDAFIFDLILIQNPYFEDGPHSTKLPLRHRKVDESFHLLRAETVAPAGPNVCMHIRKALDYRIVHCTANVISICLLGCAVQSMSPKAAYFVHNAWIGPGADNPSITNTLISERLLAWQKRWDSKKTAISST